MQERGSESQRAAVAYGAPEDPSQDVVPFRISRLDSVCNRKTEGAQVVRDDAECDILLLLLTSRCKGAVTRGLRECGSVFSAAEGSDRIEDRTEQVGFVVGDHHVPEFLESACPLHDRADALESHAGIDMAGREWHEGSVGIGIELDENKVPDLDALGAALVDQCSLGVTIRGQVDVEFRAGAAGACLAHHPEVVLPVSGDDMDRGIESLGEEEFRPQ